MKKSREGENTRNTTLVVMTMKREPCLPRPSKAEATSAESLGTMQLIAGLRRIRDPGTQFTRMVEEEIAKEDFMVCATTVASMDIKRSSALQIRRTTNLLKR